MPFGVIKPSDECPDSNPRYWKDDSNTYEQYGYCILVLFVVGLLIKNFANINKILSVRKYMSINKLLLINICIFILTMFMLAIYIDGPISLFVEGGYLKLSDYYILRQVGIYWLQIIFTLSWYLWVPVLALTYERPKERIQYGADILACLFIVGFLVQGGWTVYTIASSDICDLITNDLEPLELSTMASIISITLNDVAFVVSSFLLSRKIKALVQFKSNRHVRFMRIMAFMTFYGTCFRIIYDIMFYVNYLQAGLQKAGNEVGASTYNQIIWVLNFYFIDFSCTLIPILFLLLNFNARIDPRRHKVDLERGLQSHYEDESTVFGERTTGSSV